MKVKLKKPNRKFPYGQTKRYRQILDEVFDGEATDEQLSAMSRLISDIADGEFDTHCRHIDEDEAREWVARAVYIVKGGSR